MRDPLNGLRPTRDEIACGSMLGFDAQAPPLVIDGAQTPRKALEAVLRAALERGPCVIGFSGGRDSSVLLAVALDVARREGLPEPLPFTDRYPHVPESLEDDWQERVIAHLRPTDWLRLDHGSEHEVLGHAARQLTASHGVLLPATWAADVPPAELAVGTTVITGVGGDEMFLDAPRPILAALRARRRPPLRRLHTLPIEIAPRRARSVAGFAMAIGGDASWLRPQCHRRIARIEGRDFAVAPARYDRFLEMLWRHREFRCTSAVGAMVIEQAGMRSLDPFTSAPVVAAFATHFGARFPLSRTAGLLEIVGDLLPRDVLARESKADFTAVFVGEETRDWVRQWDGSGVDTDRVDAKKLMEAALSDDLDGRLVPSLQAAWLAGAEGQAAAAAVASSAR